MARFMFCLRCRREVAPERQRDPKSGATLNRCPDCGATYVTVSSAQARKLRRQMERAGQLPLFGEKP